MSKNVGSVDRIVRVVLAVVAALLGYLAGGSLSWALYAVAGIMLVTALVGWCPLYLPCGISTRNTFRIK